jgi:hypothetical protein
MKNYYVYFSNCYDEVGLIKCNEENLESIKSNIKRTEEKLGYNLRWWIIEGQEESCKKDFILDFGNNLNKYHIKNEQ